MLHLLSQKNACLRHSFLVWFLAALPKFGADLS